ncbi:amidase [Bordetella sp. 02P26C-1]|uniref:amidase n=1 Tax=Bordetella sp. 02P26C-1 TaxID=2683195 RepID=UPI001354B90F|nr:amidase [Bordetella sp. 02P26C-1]MVW77563.1 amidase [Bordetella sp. 02P26C-1]
MTTPNHLSVRQALQAMEAGELTSVALARACLERIAERNAEVLAFTAVDPAWTLEQARRSDAEPHGPLRGIPFAVKDVIETQHLVTAYGSPIYSGHQPKTDAACVARVKEFGGLVLGKVATSEFATQTPSQTRNPLNLAHTPGGSSSGSAAAVADFMAPVAFGTQTTASTVRPASYCGIVGYKPTFGFINVAGLKPLSPAQDTITILTRSVADAAWCGFGLQGDRVSAEPVAAPRLAVCYSSQWDAVRPEMAQAIEDLAAAAERAGAKVTRVRLPDALESIIDLQGRLFAFEARQSLAHERQHHADQFSDRLKARLSGGENIDSDEYLSMRQTALIARQNMGALFDGIDALLYPPAQGEADEGIADSGSAQFGALWSLMHVPCVSVPMTKGPKGLPMGVQVIGPYGNDLRTLQVAAFVEGLRQR